MKKLQYTDCTPDYFYRKWSGLRLFYENQGSLLALTIGYSMKRRERELFDGSILHATVLLDMYNSDLLGEEERTSAAKFVSKLAQRLKGEQVWKLLSKL